MPLVTPPRNRGGVIFSLQFVCVSVCVCVWVSDVFLLTKFKPNGYTDFDAVFAEWLLTALAQPLLKLVILGQKSRSQWRNTHFFHNSLLISLLFISALVWTIKMKFGMSLRYTLGSICGQIKKISNRWWRHCDVFSSYFSVKFAYRDLVSVTPNQHEYLNIVLSVIILISWKLADYLFITHLTITYIRIGQSETMM